MPLLIDERGSSTMKAVALTAAAAFIVLSLLLTFHERGPTEPTERRSRPGSTTTTTAPSPASTSREEGAAGNSDAPIDGTATLSVSVRDRSGAPVPGVRAEAIGVGPDDEPFQEERRSTDDGMLQWELPAPGVYRWQLTSHFTDEMQPRRDEPTPSDMTFDFKEPCRLPCVSDSFPLDAGEEASFAVVVFAASTIRGQLALADSTAHSDHVAIYASGRYEQRSVAGPAELHEVTAHCDEVGRFEATVAHGSKVVSASWVQGKLVRFATRRADVAEGDQVDLGLIAPQPDFVTEVAFRLGNSAPWDPAFVVDLLLTATSRTSAAEAVQHAVELVGDAFAFSGLSAGEWLVNATLRRSDGGEVPGVVADAGVEIILPAQGRIELVFAAKEALVTVPVRVLGADPTESYAVTLFAFDASGNSRKFAGRVGQEVAVAVPAGPTRLLATTHRYGFSDERGLCAEGTVDVLPSGNATVDLLLVPGATFRGRVTRRGEPFADRIVGFNVAGYPASESGVFVARTGEGGEVTLTGVPVGREPVLVGKVDVRWR